jgi:hypothetical protein
MPIFSPLMPPDNPARKSGASTGILVESNGSCPAMTCKRRAASSTVRAIGPAQSSDEPKAINP